MFRLIYVLYKMKLLSPLGLSSLISSVYLYGFNIMALLGFAKKVYGSKTVLIDDYESLSYEQLLSQSEKLSLILSETYQLKGGQKVGFLCRNHASLVKSIFAFSQLGLDIYLLNAEMSSSQFYYLLNKSDFDCIVYDYEFSSIIEKSSYKKNTILSYHDSLPAINNFLNKNLDKKQRPKRSSLSKIVLLTGGTTGTSKQAAHKPSLLNYLKPFLTVLAKLKLTDYNTAYIATPIFHGYGVAFLLLFIVLGKRAVINSKFEAKKACNLIRKHKVEVVTVVPLMIHKMLIHSVEDLKSLSCIVSGGAKLNPKLVEEIFMKLGDVLYNLYGTSEGGLNIIASPQDLKYSANTIGKKISGTHIKILDKKRNKVKIGNVGQLYVKNKWSMKNTINLWIKTGDLGYQDNKGYYFLCGRSDDMIISAGENVYPGEIELVIISHPQVEEAAVIGVDDEIFGQRLKAFVLPVNKAEITNEELLQWLRYRVARFQLPKEIVFVNQMPYTSLGKIDKKQLK